MTRVDLAILGSDGTVGGPGGSPLTISGVYAPVASPAFTGTPTAPTPPVGDNSTRLATTQFVAASYAPLASPVFTGTPTAPTPSSSSDSSTKIATTAWSQGVFVVDPVKQAGAKGDGVTDDTAALQAAINAIAAAGAGVLDLRHAPITFLVSSPLVLPDKGFAVVGKCVVRNRTDTSVPADITCASGFSGTAVITHAATQSTSSSVPLGLGLTAHGVSVDMTNLSPSNIADGIRFLGRNVRAMFCCVVNCPGIALNFTDMNAGGYIAGTNGYPTDNVCVFNRVNGFGITGFAAGTYAPGTLSSALSTSSPITSLPVNPLSAAIPAGQVVTAATVGGTTYQQAWTTTGAAKGATSVPVTSQTPNYAYPANTTNINAPAVTIVGGIPNGGNNTDGYFQSNVITGWCTTYGDAVNNTGPAVAFANSEDWWIESNHVQHVAQDGMWIDNVDDCRIRTNTVDRFGMAQVAGTTYRAYKLSEVWDTAAIVDGNKAKTDESPYCNYEYYHFDVHSGSGNNPPLLFSQNKVHQNTPNAAVALATLSSALSTGSPITSLPVAALAASIPAGTVFTAFGTNVQAWTTTGAAKNATSIPVTSQTPNYAYPAGTPVSGGTSYAFAVYGNTSGSRTLTLIGDGNEVLGSDGGIGDGTFTNTTLYSGNKATWVVPGHTPLSAPSTTVPLGTSNTYGAATTVLAPLAPGTFVRLRGLSLHWGGTFGSGESVTAQVVYTWDDGSQTTSALSSVSSASTQTPAVTALDPGTLGNRCVNVQLQAKSSAATTSVTLSVAASGDAAA